MRIRAGEIRVGRGTVLFAAGEAPYDMVVLCDALAWPRAACAVENLHIIMEQEAELR